MLELAMTTGCSDVDPTILLKELDEIANFHAMTRTKRRLTIELTDAR
jgi:hypothetical protein